MGTNRFFLGLAVVAVALWCAGAVQAAVVTLDGTSGSNLISTSYSTDGGLTVNLGFFVEYLIVGGGGGGGTGNNSPNQRGGGGGGAGGMLTNVGGALLQVGAASHTVTVGAGGAGGGTSTNAGSNGGDSSFAGITAFGGGGGGGNSSQSGKGGGSGGGGRNTTGGDGTPGQGHNGGVGDTVGAGWGGGGGGAGEAGGNAVNNVSGGKGGNGLQNSITGTNIYYAGGGGGRRSSAGGLGGGGGGNDSATAGTDGLGGGGGGGTNNGSGGAKGGSGVVIVRYAGPAAGSGGDISTVGTDTVHQFLTSSSLNLSGLDLDARLGATLTGTITGSGDLTYDGPGRLALAADNSYTGATTVNAGTLLVNGTHTGGGAFTVADGAALGGSGTIVGSVTVESGGTLSPGNSIESLATGALTLNAGSFFDYEMDNDAAPAAAGDLTAVTGDLSIGAGAILALTDLGAGSWNFGDKLTLISYSGDWDSGLFTYDGSTLSNNSTFIFSDMQWLFQYDDTVSGTNFIGDLTGPLYVTMTAVPEPGTWLLLLSALACGLLVRRAGKGDITDSS